MNGKNDIFLNMKHEVTPLTQCKILNLLSLLEVSFQTYESYSAVGSTDVNQMILSVIWMLVFYQ